jgi:HEAT repeat protein
MRTKISTRTLEQLLTHADPGERAEALRRVRDVSARGLAPQVEELLNDRRSEVRYESAQTLGAFLRGSGHAPHALMRRVDDRSLLVRVAAIEALGMIGDRKAATTIRSRLRDPAHLVRAYAGGSIGALRPRWARTVLAQAAATERSPRARVGLLEGLFLSGDRGALIGLLRLLRSKQYRVRSAVANTVASLALPNHEAATTTLAALERALASEPTVAARSSLAAAIEHVKRHASKRSGPRTLPRETVALRS